MPSQGRNLTNSDIDAAFARDEFDCVFQPKICLVSGKILGAEALVRWHHPDHGEMPPSIFLHYLGHQGRMQELTQRVFNCALGAAAIWGLEGHDWLVHVNLSADDLNFPGLAQTLEIELRRHGISATTIRIELSEQDVGRLSPSARNRLSRLIENGFSLAMQGPSPTPVRDSDQLTIAEFQLRGTALLGLAEAMSSTKSGRLLGLLRAAKMLGRQTSAIGLEKMVDLQTARALGFDAATGFAIARPMTLGDFSEWAANRQPPKFDDMDSQAAC